MVESDELGGTARESAAERVAHPGTVEGNGEDGPFNVDAEYVVDHTGGADGTSHGTGFERTAIENLSWS